MWIKQPLTLNSLKYHYTSVFLVGQLTYFFRCCLLAYRTSKVPLEPHIKWIKMENKSDKAKRISGLRLTEPITNIEKPTSGSE